jgi:hypothetical protein
MRLCVTSIEEAKTKKKKKTKRFLFYFFFVEFLWKIEYKKKIVVVVCGLCLQAFYQVEERHDVYER